jgi:antitoxin VapB
MKTAEIVTMGRYQAVRLPKGFHFSTSEVMVNRLGDMVVLFPAKGAWDLLARGAANFTEDFMAERRQPPGGAPDKRPQ